MESFFSHSLAFIAVLSLVAGAAAADSPPAEVRGAFLKLLDRPRVSLDPRTSKSEQDAAGHACEWLSIASEKKADGTIERVPLLVVRPEKPAAKLPAVIVLHGTGGNKESLRELLTVFAGRGMTG